MWQSSLRSWRNCYAWVTFLPRALNLRIRHGGLFIFFFLNSTVRSGLLIAWSVPGVQIVVTGQKDVSRKKVRGCGDVGFRMWRGVRTWCDVMWCGVRAKELSLPASLPPQFFPVLLIAPHSSIWTPRTDSWTLIFFSLMPKSGESVKTCFLRLWKNLNTHISG